MDTLRRLAELDPGEVVIVDLPDGGRVVAVSDRLAPVAVCRLLARHGVEHDDVALSA